MTVFRRCMASARLLTCSQPPLSSSSTLSLYNPVATLSPPITRPFPAHLNTAFRNALPSSLIPHPHPHRSFHAVACSLPSHPISRPTHLTTISRPTTHPPPTHTPTTSLPSLHALFARHFAFRKGRKGARTKLKSHSGSKKRFRFTRTGVIMRWRGGKSHKNWGKSSARLRRLSRPVAVYSGHVKMIRRSLPYGMKHSR